MTYQPKVYKKDGGDTLAIAAGGNLELNGVNLLAGFSFAIAAGAANVCEVTVTAKDNAGNALAGVFNFDVWLSDAATGAGLTGTSASGTVAAKAASGADLGTFTAKKALHAQTKADGTYILSITDAAKTGFYVATQTPSLGRPVVSRQLVAGDYGA